MYPRFTEPDTFPHIGNERNTLIVTRIDIEGLRNQRTVLTVPVTKLRYFEDYTLVIRQPIPDAAQGLPLYIRAIEDKAFIPDISAGFGLKINDQDDGHGLGKHTLEDALEANDEFVEGSIDGCDCDCNVEVIRERVEAKIFPVTTAPFGNLAFGEDLLGCFKDEPRPFVCLYLNDQNEFVIRKLKRCCRQKEHCRPRKLVKVTEVITREPKKYEAIDRDVLAVPYGHERKFRSHDYFIENGSSY